MPSKSRADIYARRKRWLKTAAGKAYMVKVRERTIKRNLDIINAFRDVPCVDCGTHLPPDCMDLDHVHGKSIRTLTGVRRSWTTMSLGRLADELEKCEVRCPNCHRLRHRKERLDRSEGR